MRITQWPHAPAHMAYGAGAYMITAGTYGKARVIRTAEHLSLVRNSLFDLAARYRWQLHAWAVLANHYHFIAISPDNPGSLRTFIRHLHSLTARELNRLDAASGRHVWFQYWDTRLTFGRSYLARLNYVNQNPVHHGVCSEATTYPWCSARWFENSADRSLVETVGRFKTDLVKVTDDF